MRERDPEGRWAYNIKRWYGIEPEDYYRMLEEQDGCCALCSSDSPNGKRLTKFHIDHCHETGKVRGLLCGKCNTFIGLANHDPDVLLRAAEYLA